MMLSPPLSQVILLRAMTKIPLILLGHQNMYSDETKPEPVESGGKRRHLRDKECEHPGAVRLVVTLQTRWHDQGQANVRHYFDTVTETYKYPAQFTRKQGDSSQHRSQGEQKLKTQAASTLFNSKITKQTELPNPLVENATTEVSKDNPEDDSSHASPVLKSVTSPVCKTENPSSLSSQNHLQELETANCSRKAELEVNVSIETEKLEAEDGARPLLEHSSIPLELPEKFQNVNASNKSKITNKLPENIKSKIEPTLTVVPVSLLSSENTQQPNTDVESVAKSEENVLPEPQGLKVELVADVEKILPECSLASLESSENSHPPKCDDVESATKSNIKTQSSKAEFVATVRSLLPQCSFSPSRSLKKFQKIRSQDIKPVSKPEVCVLPETQRKGSASISNAVRPPPENPGNSLLLSENVHISKVKNEVKQEQETEDKPPSDILSPTPHMSDSVCVLPATQKSDKMTEIVAQPDSSLLLKNNGNMVEDTERPQVTQDPVNEIVNKVAPDSECHATGSSDKLEVKNDLSKNKSTEDSDEETDYFNILTRSPKKKHPLSRLNMSHSDTENEHSSDSNKYCNVEEPKSKAQAKKVVCVNAHPNEKKELKASNKQVKTFKKVSIKTPPPLKPTVCPNSISDVKNVKESKPVTEQLKAVKMSSEISPSLKSEICTGSNSNLKDAKESKEVTKVV
ncbi:hypothetical protein B566_EDAN012565, partial [Ephemera danica]